VATSPDSSAEPYLDLVEALHDDLLLNDRARESVEHQLVNAITAAIEHGASWARIGRAMGVRRQTAWDWFQRHEQQK
jgi:hypothetical protein